MTKQILNMLAEFARQLRHIEHTKYVGGVISPNEAEDRIALVRYELKKVDCDLDRDYVAALLNLGVK
jgi:hypothetical protein